MESNSQNRSSHRCSDLVVFVRRRESVCDGSFQPCSILSQIPEQIRLSRARLRQQSSCALQMCDLHSVIVLGQGTLGKPVVRCGLVAERLVQAVCTPEKETSRHSKLCVSKQQCCCLPFCSVFLCLCSQEGVFFRPWIHIMFSKDGHESRIFLAPQMRISEEFTHAHR
jgi:hypothetical protein